MFLNLDDKVVLVTGSTTGIGSATVKLFSSFGSKVVITGRNIKNMEIVANECVNVSPYKHKPLTVTCDLISEEQVKQLANKVVEEFGRVDILVNNADSFPETDVLHANVLNEFDISTKINCRSVLQLCNLLLPHLIKTRGCIVNISGSPLHMFALNSMAKRAIESLSKVLAGEFASKGVRVNTVHVGATLTENVLKNPSFEEWKHDFTAMTALQRFADPQEIARAILFLASDLANFITGIELKCDGGIALR